MFKWFPSIEQPPREYFFLFYDEKVKTIFGVEKENHASFEVYWNDIFSNVCSINDTSPSSKEGWCHLPIEKHKSD